MYYRSRPILYTVCAVLLLGFAACKKDKKQEPDMTEFDRTVMLKDIAGNIIMPGHETFKTEAGKLSELLATLEATPTTANIEAAQAQWRKTANAWKACELFNIGEVMDVYIHNKIHTWPANKGFIDQYIYGSDVLDEAFVDGKGSSSKGLAAIEYLLFNQDGNAAVQDSLVNVPRAPRRRQYLKALGANLNTIAGALYDIWSVNGYYDRFVNSPGTGLESSTSLLVNEMAALLERMLGTKLGKPMGKHINNQPDHELAEAYISDESLALLHSNLEVLKNTFHGGADKTYTGIDDHLDAVGAKYDDMKLSEKVDAQFTTVKTALNQLSPSLNNAVYNNVPGTENAYTELKMLLVLFKVDIASNLSITITLNDNDGD